MQINNLQDGYYWVKFKAHIAAEEKWRVCFCYGSTVVYEGAVHCVNTDLVGFRATRLQEPPDVEDMPVLKDTRPYPFEPVKYDFKPVQDLTKPMGHEMNPLQRNFMDSTH